MKIEEVEALNSTSRNKSNNKSGNIDLQRLNKKPSKKAESMYKM